MIISLSLMSPLRKRSTFFPPFFLLWALFWKTHVSLLFSWPSFWFFLGYYSVHSGQYTCSPKSFQHQFLFYLLFFFVFTIIITILYIIVVINIIIIVCLILCSACLFYFNDQLTYSWPPCVMFTYEVSLRPLFFCSHLWVFRAQSSLQAATVGLASLPFAAV